MVEFIGEGGHFFVKVDIFTGNNDEFGDFIHPIQTEDIVYHISQT